jgi:hypothetical protein
MTGKAETQLTPRERLARGLTYTALGPLDVMHGVVGLGVHSTQAAALQLRRRYRKGQLAREIAADQEMVPNLPQALKQARRSRRRGKRPLVIAGLVVAVLAAGGAAFSIVRRSSQPGPSETSPRPPSVDIQPRP